MNKDETARCIALIREWSRPLSPLPAALPGWADQVPGEPPAGFGGIRAVLFDLYGTLFISAAGDIAVNNTTRGVPYGGAVQGGADTEALKAMEGFFRQEVERLHRARREAGVRWPEVAVDQIWAGYAGPLPPSWGMAGRRGASRELALRYELAVNPVYPMPGALETIRALAGRGLSLGIISNAQFFSPLLFNAFFDAPPEALGFDPGLIFYSFQAGEAKPSPRLFAQARSALARRGARPGETLYIGNDLGKDIVPAADAGFATALFAGDRRSLRLREDDPSLAGRRPGVILRDLQSLTAFR
ncbi:MAG: HAD family hydrolase [Treponema sp.]|jgi:putative hydrolase of the HAD superfamily|nr:HAD family hydrolase [Treponema sp.]